MGKSTETLSAYGSFCNRVDEILQRYAEKNSFTYIKNGGNRESYTFYDVAEFLKLAGDEFKRIGLLRGDRVAIVSPHSPFAVFVGMALAYYGVTIALIDASLPYEEIAHLISYSDVKAIFTTTALHKNLNQRIDEKLPCFSLDYGLRISSFNTAHEKCVKLGVSEDLDEDVIAILYLSKTPVATIGTLVSVVAYRFAHSKPRFKKNSAVSFLHGEAPVPIPKIFSPKTCEVKPWNNFFPRLIPNLFLKNPEIRKSIFIEVSAIFPFAWMTARIFCSITSNTLGTIAK